MKTKKEQIAKARKEVQEEKQRRKKKDENGKENEARLNRRNHSRVSPVRI
ncbi:hypothetical protein [Catenovulum sediminis]|uniref:Uncharacterized protein n=1 Tax=Catenovulum sediminis TaxID=1740262 RepID=A0ABV1RMH0_9ALTE